MWCKPNYDIALVHPRQTNHYLNNYFLADAFSRSVPSHSNALDAIALYVSLNVTLRPVIGYIANLPWRCSLHLLAAS